MTIKNAIKNAKIEGKPKVINPTANLLEVAVQYESINGTRVPKKADFMVRLRRPYDPIREMYSPEVDPDARKQISSGEYFSPVVDVIPMTKVNGETPELDDVIRGFFNSKFVDQYQ